MIEKRSKVLSPRVCLITAFIIHGSVEIPFFIFPVILILIGSDLFPNMEVFTWIGLGTLGTLGYFAAGLPSPIFGRLADKTKNGPLMVASLLMSGIGSFLIGLFGSSFFVMLICLVLMGLAMALYHPHGLSWVTKAFENPETRTYSSRYVRILSLHGVGGTLGASIGPLSVYILINVIHWRQIYFIWSFPLFFVALGCWILVLRHESKLNLKFHSPKKINTHHKENPLNNRSMILLLIFAFITTLSLTRGMINFILSPFLYEIKNVEIATAALFIGLSTLLGASGEITGGILGDKFGERAVLSSFALIQMGILTVIYISNTRFILFFFYISYGISSSLFWPSTNSIVAKLSTHRGRAFGWVMLVAHFFGALGPSIDGIFITLDPNRYFLIFGLAIVFSFCGFLFLLLSSRIPSQLSTNDFIGL